MEEDLELRFANNLSMDMHVYNKTTAEDIAGVFKYTDREPPGKCKINAVLYEFRRLFQVANIYKYSLFIVIKFVTN